MTIIKQIDFTDEDREAIEKTFNIVSSLSREFECIVNKKTREASTLHTLYSMLDDLRCFSFKTNKEFTVE